MYRIIYGCHCDCAPAGNTKFGSHYLTTQALGQLSKYQFDTDHMNIEQSPEPYCNALYFSLMIWRSLRDKIYFAYVTGNKKMLGQIIELIFFNDLRKVLIARANDCTIRPA